jgi:hypothetical protein
LHQLVLTIGTTLELQKMPGLADGNDLPASTKDNLGWDFELSAMDRDSDFAALL